MSTLSKEAQASNKQEKARPKTHDAAGQDTRQCAYMKPCDLLIDLRVVRLNSAVTDMYFSCGQS